MLEESVKKKFYGSTGILLLLTGFFNVMEGSSSWIASYTLLCLGSFVFLDALNFFILDSDSILAGEVTVLNAFLFLFVAGGALAFIAEIYGAMLTGVWEGLAGSSLRSQGVALLVYGMVFPPLVAAKRVSSHIARSESMLLQDYDASDSFTFLIHLGLFLMFLPFILIFFEGSWIARFSLFLSGIVGSLMVLEYFQFRRKGEGALASALKTDVKTFGRILTLSTATGLTVSLLMASAGLTVFDHGPEFYGIRMASFIVWAVLAWVALSSVELLTSSGLCERIRSI